jgi:hypothetical protein
MIIGADLPAPPQVNPPESKRTVVDYFGTYSVDEAPKPLLTPQSDLLSRILTGAPARHP